jgi:hypothetical protein
MWKFDGKILTEWLPEVNHGVVVLEHVDLINVLEGLNSYSTNETGIQAGTKAYRTS